MNGENISFIERKSYSIENGCYAVTDGESWEVYPQQYCRGANIVKCRVCGKPATHVDAQYPYFDEFNLCDEHYNNGGDTK